MRVRGGTRQDALRWAAEVGGFVLDDRPLSASERASWARTQRHIELHLPNARLWRRAALALGEMVLDGLKDALWDPKAPRPEIGEIASLTAQLEAWRRIDGAALVTEYLWWKAHDPRLTAGMVRAAKLRETARRGALKRYLGLGPEEGL